MQPNRRKRERGRGREGEGENSQLPITNYQLPITNCQLFNFLIFPIGPSVAICEIFGKI
ncbi:MAG: hypothetical protein HC849_07590 [Oscillatoriales cyanobacterium RU_3_3]|nr:hypothetical protein [Oscillatoriales cyanobacterium RU_3_3]